MASVVSFSSLPLEIVVHHIAPFLGNVDLSSLSKVNSSLHTHLRHVRLFHLWPMYNRMYIEDAQFRDEVKTTIPVGRLVLVSFDQNLQDLSAFEGVHAALLNIPKQGTGRYTTCSAADLTPLNNVHTVDIRLDWDLSDDSLAPLANARIVRLQESRVPTFAKAESVYLHDASVDVNRLAGIPRVCLVCCETEQGAPITNLSALRRARFVEINQGGGYRKTGELEDLSCLESAREVVIKNCEITILPPTTHLRAFTWHGSTLKSIPPELGGMRFLNLSGSSNLEDVSAAGTVSELVLLQCFRVRDVSALGSVHTLRISDCGSSLDVSALGSVHTLDFDNVYLKGVSRLGNVHRLNLCGAKFDVCDVSRLGTVHTLCLEFVNVTDVSTLGGVHTLLIPNCKGVVDVSALSNCHTLNLEGCGVSDVRELGRVHTLNLGRTSVSDVSMLGDVHTLKLDQTCVSDVSLLGGVHTLDLTCCKNVVDVSALGGVYDLNLSGCKSVSDVSMLGAVHSLNVTCCPFAHDLSCLAGVHTLNLSGCQITDVGALCGVHTLILDSTPVCDIACLSGPGRVRVLSVKQCANIDRRQLDFIPKVFQ
eukprot:Opistho-2@93715